MSNKQSSLIVIIPAYNEAFNIKEVVSYVLELGHDIVVVDDGSSDDTALLARQAGATVCQHQGNKGYESALMTGFEYAVSQSYKYAITFDADGQMDAQDITRFREACEKDEKVSLVVGKRSYRNRYCEHLLGFWGKIRFGLSDPLCGMKLYNISELKALRPFDSRELVGMELAFKAIDGKKKFVELPIQIQKRENGSSRYGHSLKGELKILRSLAKTIKEFGLKKGS